MLSLFEGRAVALHERPEAGIRKAKLVLPQFLSRLHLNGQIPQSTPSRPSAPEIIVTPARAIGAQRTSLNLRSQNFTGAQSPKISSAYRVPNRHSRTPSPKLVREMEDRNHTPPAHTGIIMQRGLEQIKALLTPGEPEDEFESLAQCWLDEYRHFRSPAFDHQLLKLIETDWLHRRALLTIGRAEQALALAEAQHETRERIGEISAFIRRMSRRCAVHEQRFDNALRRVEAYRKARIVETLANAQIVRTRDAFRRDYVTLHFRLLDRKSEAEAKKIWEAIENTVRVSIPYFPFNQPQPQIETERNQNDLPENT